MGVWVPAQGESWLILLRLLNISVPTLIVLKCETLSREGEEAEGEQGAAEAAAARLEAAQLPAPS